MFSAGRSFQQGAVKAPLVRHFDGYFVCPCAHCCRVEIINPFIVSEAELVSIVVGLACVKIGGRKIGCRTGLIDGDDLRGRNISVR